ncbi:MAG: hypothetical protein KJN76_05620 [Eudoraea sp.]|nr:hypothetical protein [Eudoraea sp.]
MKTPHIIKILSVTLLFSMGSCKSGHRALGALEAPDQLKLEKKVSAYLVTTEEAGELLLLETASTTTKQKKPQAAWSCSCGKPVGNEKCEIVTSEGSDKAECRGGCFCGFKKAPVPTSAAIVSKMLLKTLKAQNP